ncbi:MAG: TonB-dependent receptor [Opitutales bacterium]|nr:TonB-dependent receptor [Opitutales bacterium]
MELQRIKSLAVLTCGMSFAAFAQGAGFAIIEQSASGIGNAFAGGAAAAEDASTIFFNPAGMILLDSPELQSGAHIIAPYAKFVNEGTTTAGSIVTQGADSDGGETALVPNFYYAHPINERLVVGLGIHAPFGLATEFDKDSIVRYQAVRSEIQTINVNPSLAYRINSKLTVGFGLSAEYVYANLTNALDFNADGTSLLDGFLDLEGDDIGYGWNLGLLYELSSSTRFGVHYRSRVETTLEGEADITVPSALAAHPVISAAYVDQDIHADLTLPDSLSVSFFHQFNPRWSIMGDVTWMNWSKFYQLDIVFEETGIGSPIIENWRDNWRYSLAANYQASDVLKLRAGVAYDQTPVRSSEFRSPRIPDASRVWLTLGASWDISSSTTLDLGYVHIFVDDPVVNNSTHTANQHVVGTIKAHVDILSASCTLRF